MYLSENTNQLIKYREKAGNFIHTGARYYLMAETRTYAYIMPLNTTQSQIKYTSVSDTVWRLRKSHAELLLSQHKRGIRLLHKRVRVSN